jgi:hypothetical protein
MAPAALMCVGSSNLPSNTGCTELVMVTTMRGLSPLRPVRRPVALVEQPGHFSAKACFRASRPDQNGLQFAHLRDGEDLRLGLMPGAETTQPRGFLRAMNFVAMPEAPVRTCPSRPSG